MVGKIVTKACLATLLVLSFTTAQAQEKTDFKLQEGDLLFQDLDCGPLCDAIEKVTMGHKGSTFSHVGLVTIKNGNISVIEAIGDSVRLTPLAKFLNRNLDQNQKPKVAVGRLKKPFQKLIPEAVAKACTYRGAPYDNAFLIENNAFYCSELVYLAFEKPNTLKPVFDLAPMTYIDPDTRQMMGPWVDYFKELQLAIPEGKPGINPGGISRSKALKMFYPYGKPDTLK